MKAAEIPVWSPEKGNIFEWVLVLALTEREEKEKPHPSSYYPFNGRITKARKQ